MSVWQKMRDNLQDSLSSASAKASELIKSGAEAVREGTEKAAEKASYMTKLAQLNYAHHEIEKLMDKEYLKLGECLFKLRGEDRLSELEKEAAEYFNELAALKKKLEGNEEEKKELIVANTLDQNDREEVEKLAKELEEHGGRMLHVTIKSGSLFVGKKIRDIELPSEALFGTIVRGDEIVIPDGETVLLAGDKVSLLGKQESVQKAVEMMIGS